MKQAINITRLPSGILVVTEQMNHVETVSLGAYVSVGTRHEKAKENGISHFLEHMAFKGTQTRSASEIAETVENVGGHINAFTARELTAYYLKLLKGDIELGVDILGDILTHSVFDATEFEKERNVILQEIGQANDTPDEIIFDYFQETAYPDQPMGRPTLGTSQIIKTMRKEDLQHYMHSHYSAKNIIFSAAGNLDHDAVVDFVNNSFKDIPQHNQDTPTAALYKGGEYKKIKALDQAHIILGFPSFPFNHPQYYASTLLSIILGGGMSSRLFQEIREKRGLVYTIYAYNITHQDDGIFSIYTGTGKEQVKELMPVLIQELKHIQNMIKPEELQRTKTQLKSSLLMSMESTNSRCEQLARHLQIYGRILSPQEISDRIDAVTIEDIYQAAHHIFHSHPTLTALGPIQNVPSLSNIIESLAE